MDKATVITQSNLVLPKKLSRYALKEMNAVEPEEKLLAEYNLLRFEYLLRDAIEGHNGRYTTEEENQLVSTLANFAYYGFR